MACLFPIYFVASTSLPMLEGHLESALLLASAISWVLIFGLPTLVSRYQRHDFRSVYMTSFKGPRLWLTALPGVVLLAGSLWMFAHEIMIVSRQIGIATITEDQLNRTRAFAEKLQSLPLGLLLFSGAITPAICEEWFFRGFVMSALRRFGKWNAVLGSAALFALMHVLTSNVLSLERLLPSLFMESCWGWWPGVLARFGQAFFCMRATMVSCWRLATSKMRSPSWVSGSKRMNICRSPGWPVPSWPVCWAGC